MFNTIAASITLNFEEIAKQEDQISGLPYEKYNEVSKRYLCDLLENHKIVVIVFDKSKGTKYENTKSQMIEILEKHIKYGLSLYSKEKYEDIFPHMLATNFVESFLEVARHYKDADSARKLFNLVTKCYFEGVNSL